MFTSQKQIQNLIQVLPGIHWVVVVTDKGTKVCVDPGGNGAILNEGGAGGPGPPGGGRSEQLVPESGGG